MTPKIKKIIYLVLFTVLGFAFGTLVEFLVELYYIKLLFSDFKRYSFGLSWSDLEQLRDFFAVLVLIASGVWGYVSGKYWWRQIYELKQYKHWNWFRF